MLILGIIDVPVWLLLIVLATVAYLWHETRYFNYFKKQGITGNTPYPIIGSLRLWGEAVKIYPAMDVKLRKKHGNTVSEFIGQRPTIIVFDDSFISQVMVKEFRTFACRFDPSDGMDQISAAMLNTAKWKQWKRLRPIMSPTFSTGKLKRMMAEINRCASQMASAVVERNGQELEFKACSGCYTLDAVASTAFGVRLDSQKDQNNKFVEKAKKAFDVALSNPAMLIMVFFPLLTPVLKLFKLNHFFPKDVISFFKDVTSQAVEARKQEKNQDKIDFLQLMINAQQGEDIRDDGDEAAAKDEAIESEEKMALTDTELLANGILFFLAGYDTTATTLALLLYNLALNPECQDQLIKEIDSVVGDKETVSSDMLSKMPYLEQCLHESLRLFPPAVRTNRVAEQDVTINGVHLKAGMIVQIPIYAIHHDETKWPEPEKFIPERFSPENKATHGPFDYMPFGYGPRNCIAMRLALAEVKVATAHLLRKVRITTSAKTDIPMHFKPLGLLVPKNGVWLKPEMRASAN